jgi:methionyl-tRNA formyltransferase
MSVSMRVLAVSGSPDLARALAGAARARGHTVVAVLTTPGTRTRRGTGYRAVVEAFGEETDVIVSSKPSHWARAFAPYDLDVMMCCGFPWRLPTDFLAIPRHGAINMHPSLLPKYRGAGPNVFGWMLRNDEREAGITVHRMSPEFDTGPILAQLRTPIDVNDDARALIQRLGPLVPPALDRALAAVEAGEPGEPQSGDGFYCERFDESWREVDWSQPARSVHLQIRSWTGLEDHGHAHARIEGVPMVIKRSRLVDGDGRTAPGAVLARDEGGLLVQCGDCPIRIIDWEARQEVE